MTENTRIVQFRYAGDGNSNNFPVGLTSAILAQGNIFSGYGNISKIVIQGIPGTAFCLNNSDYSIYLGNSGIYHLDLQNRGLITSINFIKNGIFSMYNSSNILLIDIVYSR